jgi:hypothetical protein
MIFIRWLWQVIKKGFWVLGFLPTLIEIITTYIPNNYIPKSVSEFMQRGFSLQLSLTLVVIGLFISAFLVYKGNIVKLAAYENQAPEYELKINEVTRKFYPPERIQVECDFSMIGIKPWSGDLSNIIVERRSNIKKFIDWKIKGVYWLHRDNVYIIIKEWPYSIPQNESGFRVSIYSDINKSIDEEERVVWEHIMIPVRLIIQYYSQPVGQVQKKVPMEIKVDLSKEFDLIRASRKNIHNE